MADGTISVAGRPVKKGTAAIAALAIGVVVVAVYRHNKAASSAAASPAADQAASTDGTAAFDSQAGFAGGGGFGLGGVSIPADGGGTGSTVPVFTDNASWAQYAESYLTGVGDDPNAVGNALGKYITGQPVTPAQQALIQQAIAFANKPPVAGQGGFPPSINLLPTGPPVGGGGGGGGGDHDRTVPLHVIRAPGGLDFQQIANRNGVTEAQLKHANPSLAARWEGTGRALPKGIRVIIPEHVQE